MGCYPAVVKSSPLVVGNDDCGPCGNLDSSFRSHSIDCRRCQPLVLEDQCEVPDHQKTRGDDKGKGGGVK